MRVGRGQGVDELRGGVVSAGAVSKRRTWGAVGMGLGTPTMLPLIAPEAAGVQPPEPSGTKVSAQVVQDSSEREVQVTALRWGMASQAVQRVVPSPKAPGGQSQV